ncbi:MAG TPA: hydantoinase/oxoprolinase family protein [Candidatus Methylomirabilis sp.]|nr:hydantoinase/oxoprolinase family protein [Candidatus Methylomirabilis sp.]
MMSVIGWDVGGANIKAAYVSRRNGGRLVQTASRPFEIWRGKESLPEALRSVASDLPPGEATAVTMTAELSDAFRSKREGVDFVLDAMDGVTPGSLAVFTTGGGFVDAATARARPLEVAASNWAATALVVTRHLSEAILVDVGSTTTDVIPIHAGRVAARGRTDPERLLHGELVYTGAVRTNVAAIVSRVPLWGGECPVAAEYFAVSGDAHLLLGSLDSEDYTCPTPDGRPATPAFAAERLARVVCADGEMLGQQEIERIARAVAEAQLSQIASAISVVAAGFPSPPEAVVTGQGAFLARGAAQRCGLTSRDLSSLLGVDVGIAAPAVAVAWLLLASTG